jgi:hypothetical protein
MLCVILTYEHNMAHFISSYVHVSPSEIRRTDIYTRAIYQGMAHFLRNDNRKREQEKTWYTISPEMQRNDPNSRKP